METWTHFRFLWSLDCVFDNGPVTHFAFSCPFCLSPGTVLRIKGWAVWGWVYSFRGLLSPITTNLVVWNDKNLFFTVLEAGGPTINGSEGLLSLRRLAGRISSLLLPQPLLLAGTPWPAQGCRPIIPSSASPHISPCLFSSPKDTTPLDLGATLLLYNLILTNYVWGEHSEKTKTSWRLIFVIIYIVPVSGEQPHDRML